MPLASPSRLPGRRPRRTAARGGCRLGRYRQPHHVGRRLSFATLIRAGRILVLVLLLLVAGCGDEPTPSAGDSKTASPTPAATRTASPSPAATPASADCSAAELSVELPAQELPPAVADKRAAIAQAAMACDYEALEALAGDDRFTFSFGASNDAADFWRSREDAGEEVLSTLVRLLALPFTRSEAGGDGRLYAWPSAHTENPTSRDWKLLRGIYDRGEIESFQRMGSYLGYRVGIDGDGEWRFFVAGD